MKPLAYVAAWRGCLSFLDEHADLFPAAQDSLTPQAFAAADADADVATAGPLDFLAAAWRDATLQLGGDEDMQAALGAEVTGPERLARAPKSIQKKMTAAFSLRQRDAMLRLRSDPGADGDSPQIAGSVDSDDNGAGADDYMRWHHPVCLETGEAPSDDDAERVGACREEAGAFLRAIPHNPKFLLSNGDFKGALAWVATLRTLA